MTDQMQPNPLLQRATIPGQTFALPSGGVFYKHGEMDDSVQDGEIIVSPMVTMDELIMKTPDKILNGTGIVEVFKRCIPQVTDPNLLLAKDVDFLLVCLRKVTYGHAYEVEYTHDCKDAKKHSYIIELDPLISAAKKIDALTYEKDYTLTLPNSQVVKLTPPKYYQMLQFYQTFNTEVSEKVAYDRMIEATVSLIEQVDDITDRVFITEWVRTIPAGYTRSIGDRVAELSKWGADLNTSVVCQDCKEEAKVSISLNPMHFFS